MLAEYAVRESQGRRHPEPPHAYRNDFQRDRDRVIHSRAFRRLEAKTQVFTRRYSDHFRTRLTHTLEVAQISRTIAGQLGSNVDLVEALALVHDIGHPPFGHAGEKALDSVMRELGESFDHNLHALRIVEDFELRYAAYRGLNLTFEVREGIVKHSRDYAPEKYPELADYLLELRPPLEAQLIDLADEIAYTAADFDDGYEARLISLDNVLASVPVFGRFYADVERLYSKAIEKMKFNEALKRVLNLLVTDVIENTRARLLDAGVASLQEVRQYPERLLAFSPEVDSERRTAKAFLYRTLYNSPALEPEKQKAESVIRELFAFWMAQPSTLPRSYRDKIRNEPEARVICDYIAGMTDTYILEQYERHCGRGAMARVPGN